MKFEYVVKEDCTPAQLNIMGDNEWELVQVVKDFYKNVHWFYFKREKK